MHVVWLLINGAERGHRVCWRLGQVRDGFLAGYAACDWQANPIVRLHGIENVSGR